MPGVGIRIILDEIYNKDVPKPINNRPGYDMNHARKYLGAYYHDYLNKKIEVEKEYDILSVVKPGQSLVAWAVSVRIRLQELLADRKESIYHQHCFFAGSGDVKMDNVYDYRRLQIHESNKAICFDCWKLIEIPDVKPKKTYSEGWRRWIHMITPEDLMQDHWDNECTKAKTRDGSARIIQRAYRNHRKRPETWAKRVWDIVRNDGTPNDKKFLGIDRSGASCYEKSFLYSNYYSYKVNIRGDFVDMTWAEEKSYQFRERLWITSLIVTFVVLHHKGYRIVEYTGWSEMLKWLTDPEYYRFNAYGVECFVRSSEYARYRCKQSGKPYPCNSVEINYFKLAEVRIHGKRTVVDFSDLENNHVYVQRVYRAIECYLSK